MPVSNTYPTRNLQGGTLVIQDGTPTTPLTLTVIGEEGNLEWTAKPRPGVPVTDRDLIETAFDAPAVETPMTFSFTIKYRYCLAETPEPLSPYEALLKKGGAAAWVSTTSAGTFRVNLQFTIANPIAASKSELIVLPDAGNFEVKFAEGKEFNTLQVSGDCLAIEPTITRPT